MSRPNVPTDVAELLAELARIQENARQLAGHVADLHLLAYERPVTGESAGGRSTKNDPLERWVRSIGDDGIPGLSIAELAETSIPGRAVARKLWRAVRSDVHHAAVQLGALDHALRSVLGGDSNVRLRDSEISHEQFQQARDAQLRRQARAGDPVARATLERRGQAWARHDDEDTTLTAEYQPSRASGVMQPGYPRPAPEHQPVDQAGESKVKRRGWKRVHGW